MNFPFQFVQREIEHLEGKPGTTTKLPGAFKATGILAAFMHKHFYVPGYEHLGRNAQQAWKLQAPNSKKLHEMISRIANPYRNQEPSDTNALEFSQRVANELVVGPGGVEDRLKGKATGDWLVYREHDGENYYLCIAKHDEDDFIVEAIRNCFADFPFLSSFLPPA